MTRLTDPAENMMKMAFMAQTLQNMAKTGDMSNKMGTAIVDSLKPDMYQEAQKIASSVTQGVGTADTIMSYALKYKGELLRPALKVLKGVLKAQGITDIPLEEILEDFLAEADAA